MPRTYELRDCEQSRREFPRSFSIPRLELRRALEPGWLVKMVFGLPAPVENYDAERMWVEVLRPDGNGGYIGRLDNQPYFVKDLNPNDEIAFEPRHVAAIDNNESRTLGALVGIGTDVLRNDAWPAWIARVEPTTKHDSGWRVFSEREAEEGATLRALSTSTLFRSWAVTDSAIDVGWDGVFRWDEASCEYVRADALPAPLLEAANGDLGRLHVPPPDPELEAVVTSRALQEQPRMAQRLPKAKDYKEDSGWCIFVGDELQSHLDDSHNSTVVPIARLLHAYPYLERVLGETKNAMWEWDDATADWRLVPQSKPKKPVKKQAPAKKKPAKKKPAAKKKPTAKKKPPTKKKPPAKKSKRRS